MPGSSATEIRDLIAAIETAFASVQRGMVTLHEAEVMDAYGTDEERREARERDRELDWRDVQEPSLLECSCALSHLDPAGWRFYLPAFIRVGLRNLGRPGDDAIDWAIYSLLLSEDPALAHHSLERFAMLDSAQVRAVRRFLELAADHDAYCDGHAAQQALARHWAAAG